MENTIFERENNLMFSRIWACILAFLVSIFPWLGNYEPKLDVNAAVETVIAAIKTRDIDAIEAFMCKNIKDNVPDLREEIGKMIDAIEGSVTSVSSKNSEVFYVSVGGKTINQSISVSDIDTSVGKYQLNITWETYNNFSVEERGIRQIALFIPPSDTEGYVELSRIRATSGIQHVHD